jgi:predicted flap endonuclease-1-like 5' DNA nuclease
VLDAPEAGRAPDDLKLISGIGPKIESTLNEKGIYYFDQLAVFGGAELAWADRTLGFRGRVVRDRWIPQAKALAAQQAQRNAAVGASSLGEREETSSGAAPVNAPLKLSEAEALRLIERDGGYAATSQNRPAMLLAKPPKGEKGDDLTRIRGIGDKLQASLNKIGVYHFSQIAEMKADEVAWIDSKLSFKGRIIRDRWIPQAEKFMRGKKS